MDDPELDSFRRHRGASDASDGTYGRMMISRFQDFKISRFLHASDGTLMTLKSFGMYGFGAGRVSL